MTRNSAKDSDLVSELRINLPAYVVWHLKISRYVSGEEHDLGSPRQNKGCRCSKEEERC